GDERGEHRCGALRVLGIERAEFPARSERLLLHSRQFRAQAVLEPFVGPELLQLGATGVLNGDLVLAALPDLVHGDLPAQWSLTGAALMQCGGPSCASAKVAWRIPCCSTGVHHAM